MQRNRVVLKFPAPHRDETIKVTLGAKVVLCDHQDGVPTLWIELDPSETEIEWRVISCATGEYDRIGSSDIHLGSVVVREPRWLVWHLYVRGDVTQEQLPISHKDYDPHDFHK